ncbi:GNAT family N-acetyltransferase [Siculibacillus lacustris]|uniref:GNAT family N-acetyltransferase n=1 Tax=Siculibacillus lacustris TaxID=1549641 RepID=UPI001D1898E5|nr:GNAT family N-acetyltransferase [Siculibacillus lacustris]
MSDLPTFRSARPDDLGALVAIFAADALGGHGDTTDPSARDAYRAALDAILADPRDRLVVAELAGVTVGTGQLTLLRSLPHRGRIHALIEAVQVASGNRGRGIGAALIAHLVALARTEGAGVVELTSNAARLDAHRFYERLGFARSHVGFKMTLTP